jgi:HEAT repeat protein
VTASDTAPYLAQLTELLPDLLAWESFDQHFDAVEQLRDRLGPVAELVGVVRELCGQPDEELRALGFDLLAVAAEGTPELVALLVEEAGRLAREEVGEDLRWSVAHALGSANDPAVVEQLLAFADDPDSDVRQEVASGIPTDFEELPEAVVEALLELMSDRVAAVRDWATFSLGVLNDADTPQIREALAGRLTDGGADTAGEAAVALARRGDPRAYAATAEQLPRPNVGSPYLEAAIELADPRLYPLLRQLHNARWPCDDPRLALLEEALTACAPAPETTP